MNSENLESYIPPLMEVLLFEQEDIITLSGEDDVPVDDDGQWGSLNG